MGDAAFAAAMEAAEECHVLTIGSPARNALRVTRGKLDSRHRFHDRRLDVFPIWRGCRYEWRELRAHAAERSLARLARLVPRSIRYYVVINEAAAVSRAEPQKVVPEITWADMARHLELDRPRDLSEDRG